MINLQDDTRVRNLMAISLVYFIIVISSVLAAAPYLTGDNPSIYTDHLKTFVSMFTGILGFILGKFFK